MTKLPLYVIAIPLLLSLVGAVEARERSKIRWGKNLTEAVAEAQKTGKPIVVFFRRETSEPLSEGHNGEVVESMAYERIVLSDRMVQSYAKDALFVKLFPADLKPGSYDEQVAKSLKIEQYPVLAVLEVSGGQLHFRGMAKGATNFRSKHYPVLNALIAALQNTEASRKSRTTPAASPATAKPEANTPSGSSASTPALPDIKPSSKRFPGGLATERDLGL